jgi:elongation factor P
MIAATQIKRGMTIKLNGELYRVFSFQHITPGNWRGMVQTKLKSLKSGSIIEHRFRSEDRVEQAYLETHEVEYLYSDGSDYYFMNTETFEQFHLPSDLLADAIPYMSPNIKLKITKASRSVWRHLHPSSFGWFQPNRRFGALP